MHNTQSVVVYANNRSCWLAGCFPAVADLAQQQSPSWPVAVGSSTSFLRNGSSRPTQCLYILQLVFCCSRNSDVVSLNVYKSILVARRCCTTTTTTRKWEIRQVACANRADVYIIGTCLVYYPTQKGEEEEITEKQITKNIYRNKKKEEDLRYLRRRPATRKTWNFRLCDNKTPLQLPRDRQINPSLII